MGDAADHVEMMRESYPRSNYEDAMLESNSGPVKFTPSQEKWIEEHYDEWVKQHEEHSQFIKEKSEELGYEVLF